MNTQVVRNRLFPTTLKNDPPNSLYMSNILFFDETRRPVTVGLFIMCFEVAASFCDRNKKKHQTPKLYGIVKKRRAKTENSAVRHRCNKVVQAQLCKNHLLKERPVVGIKTASIFRSRDTAPSVFWYSRTKKKRRGIDSSFIAPSENFKFSLSKQGALCRLKDVCTGWVSNGLLRSRSCVDFGGYSWLALPAMGSKERDRCLLRL